MCPGRFIWQRSDVIACPGLAPVWLLTWEEGQSGGPQPHSGAAAAPGPGRGQAVTRSVPSPPHCRWGACKRARLNIGGAVMGCKLCSTVLSKYFPLLSKYFSCFSGDQFRMARMWAEARTGNWFFVEIGIVVEIYRGPNIFSGALIYFCCLAAAATVEVTFGRYWPGTVQQSDLMVGLNNNLATQQPSSLQPGSNCLRIVNFATCQQFGGWHTGTPHSRREIQTTSVEYCIFIFTIHVFIYHIFIIMII